MKNLIFGLLSILRGNDQQIFAAKKQVRQQVRKLKQTITEDEKNQEADAVFCKIETFPEFKAAKTILLYWSTPDELPTHATIRKWSAEKQLILPTIEGDDLILKHYLPNGAMKQGELGIWEPDTAEICSGNVDLVIVPGVAFDHKKNRLGRGKGYYDRFFRKNGNVLKIGVGFDFQLLTKIPSTKMDIKMDKIVTASKIIK